MKERRDGRKIVESGKWKVQRNSVGERAADSTYIDWVFRKLTHIFNFPEDL